MTVNYNPQCVQNGLVFYLDAINSRSYPKSGTAWFDISNNALSGVLINSPTFSGNFFAFDGTNSLIRTSGDPYSQWTIGMLIKLNLSDYFLGSTTFFSHTPAAGAATEGYLRIGDDLFHNINTCYIDADQNIYVGGQHGGYNNTIAASICKISPLGSLINTFSSPAHDGAAINCGYVYENSGQILYGGTNLGNIGITHVDKITGLTTGITQTSQGVGAGGQGICSDIIIDSGNNAIYVIANRATTYQNTATSGGLLKMQLDTKNIITQFDTSTGFNVNTSPITGRLDNSGNLYVVGDFTTYKGSSYNRIIKINKNDATADTSFNPGTGFNLVANTIAIDSSGRLLVGGNFTSYNGTSINRIVRLNTNGSIDSSFNAGTGFSPSQVRRIRIDPSGRILVGGDFTSYNGVSANRIVRLNTDGSRDNSFNIGTGFNSFVSDIGFAASGQLVVVGEFSSYNGNTTPAKICRLNENGSYDSTFAPSGFNVPLYRGRFETRLAGGVSQNNFGGTFGISPNRNTFSLPNGSYLWNNYAYLNIVFSSGKAFKFYRNGILYTTLNATGSANCNLSLRDLLFKDNLYLFQLYNRELSQAEIIKNYDTYRKRLGF